MKDAALNRVSTRTFKNEQLQHEDIDKISEFIYKANNMNGPFDHSFELTYYLNKAHNRNGKKIGTYGLIKNPPLFAGGICQNDFHSIVDYGYVFQHLILELTNAKLGTCWLGGTFKRKHFESNLNKGEIIPAITPIGYPAENRSFVDRSLRSVAQSKSRFSMKEIFKLYNGSELSFTEDNIILQSLSMVRRAPSASNKQPWRAFIDDSVVHFYLKRTPKYPAISLGYDIQALDIGIALRNYTLGLEHYNANYEYIVINEPKSFKGMEYVLSVKTVA